MTSARINIGVVGLGLAGMGVLPAIAGTPGARLVGATDTNPRALRMFHDRYSGKTYETMEALCEDPEIDTVWIATPNALHCPQTILAASRGKHVIVEKPMAISLVEAERMIEAAESGGVHLICGGSRSSSSVVRMMREIVKSGELGAVRAMTTWAATDWMLRPRRPDEYDVSQGGGVVFRQAPHQIDSVRLIGGGLVRSVRGITGQWMAPRDKAPGFFTALLDFEDGPFATLIYSSYGYFMGTEFFDPGVSGPSEPGTRTRVEARHQIVSGTRDEERAKEERAAPTTTGSAGNRSALLSDLGLLVVSCEHGELRQSQTGLYVYTDNETKDLPLPRYDRSTSPELEELLNALDHDVPILHSGRWGLATLEVSLSIMRSSDERREVPLQYQVPVPDWS